MIPLWRGRFLVLLLLICGSTLPVAVASPSHHRREVTFRNTPIRRDLAAPDTNETSNESIGPNCRDVNESPDKCSFVSQHCERLGIVDYLNIYYCSNVSHHASIFLFVVLLSTLFITIGMTASDFLCPNLSNISRMMGLSQSVAGVTFLALGNGSPDVFSTYAALKSGSVSMAVGELLGAASIITAVVIGLMAIIHPFSVTRNSFLRDNIFFITAIVSVLYFIMDRKLIWWECFAMFAFYLLYVVVVVVWHYTAVMGRKTGLETDSDMGRQSPISLHSESFADLATEFEREAIQIEDSQDAYNELTSGMHLAAPSTLPHIPSPRSPVIRPSLRGALEFVPSRSTSDVSSVSLSLGRRGSSSDYGTSRRKRSRSLSPFGEQSPIFGSASRSTRSATPSSESNRTWTELPDQESVSSRIQSPSPERISDITDHRRIPRLIITSADDNEGPALGSPEQSFAENHISLEANRPLEQFTKRSLTLNIARQIFVFLFPSLTDMRDKGIFARIVTVITIPSIILLSLTVPIPHNDEDEAAATALEDDRPSGSIVGSPLLYENRIIEGRYPAQWKQNLLSIQCFLAPIVIMIMVFYERDDFKLFFILSIPLGFASSLVFTIYAKYFRPNSRYSFLSFLGFVVSILYVSTIANEIVGLMKAFCTIFHVSEAFFGLTVFALGNSLGDLVSNITVARMGYPMMAFSACFGGPMLNIMLGIGLSGVVVLSKETFRHKPYFSLELNPAIIVTSITLLMNLLFLLIGIPAMGWRINRAMGAMMVCFWLVSLAIGLISEIY